MYKYLIERRKRKESQFHFVIYVGNGPALPLRLRRQIGV